MGKACRVPGCNKLFKTKRSMFKVPLDETERKKWAVALPEIKDLKASHFICEKHFDSAFILRKYEKFDEIGKLIAEVSIIFEMTTFFLLLKKKSNVPNVLINFPLKM